MAEDPMRASDAPTGEVPLGSWKEIGPTSSATSARSSAGRRPRACPCTATCTRPAPASTHSPASSTPGGLDGDRPTTPRVGGVDGPGAAARRASTLMLVLALATVGDGRALRASAPDEGGSGTVRRLVWTGPLVDLLGAPSPDGSYLAVTDWETGNLAIRESSTGVLRRLTENDDWDGWAEFPVPSPDGKNVGTPGTTRRPRATCASTRWRRRPRVSSTPTKRSSTCSPSPGRPTGPAFWRVWRGRTGRVVSPSSPSRMAR